MPDNPNTKSPFSDWKLVVGYLAAALVAFWVLIRVLQALAGLIRFGITVAVLAAIAAFIMKTIGDHKTK